jgi:ABC-2 type transport system ATP-binding protein
MNEIAIRISGLKKNYGSFEALKGIDLTVSEGDFVAFLGPNGAGKTTTIHCVTGLSNFQEGSIRVFGMDVVADYRRTRPLLGLCPQDINLDPFLSIEQVLVYQAGYFGVPRGKALERANELLKYFGLDDKRKGDFRKLSGGMKRRLLLCRALVHDPKILILDEPTAGADLELRHRIWDYLLKLNAAGKTIFLTTHYMEEAEKLSKTVVIVDKGRVIHSGDKQELLKDKSLETRFLELTKNHED